MVKRIGCAIINWNGSVDTIELIQSLDKLMDSGQYQLSLAIVDNASVFDQFNILEKYCIEYNGDLAIDLARNAENVGVPQAYNQAIQMLGLGFDYYLRLDNDVIIIPDGLHALVNCLETGPNDVGAVGGNIKYYTERELNNGGAVSIDLVGGVTKVAYPEYPIETDGILGCVMLIPGFIVKRFYPNIFDAYLFLGMDESELSHIMNKSGYKTMYIPNLVAYHKSGASTGRVSFTSKYFTARNWAYLRCKYTSGNERLLLGINFMYEFLKSILRGRFYYVYGSISGVCYCVFQSVDSSAKPKAN